MSTLQVYRQTSVSQDALYKLDLSRSETEGLSLRDIRCPYCGYLVERVALEATRIKDAGVLFFNQSQLVSSN